MLFLSAALARVDHLLTLGADSEAALADSAHVAVQLLLLRFRLCCVLHESIIAKNGEGCKITKVTLSLVTNEAAALKLVLPLPSTIRVRTPLLAFCD